MVTVSIIIIRPGREHSGCGNTLQKWQKAISQCGLEVISYFYEPRTCSGKGISCMTDLNRPICDVTTATHNPLAWLWPVLLQQDLVPPQMALHPVVPGKHVPLHHLPPPHPLPQSSEPHGKAEANIHPFPPFFSAFYPAPCFFPQIFIVQLPWCFLGFQDFKRQIVKIQNIFFGGKIELPTFCFASKALNKHTHNDYHHHLSSSFLKKPNGSIKNCNFSVPK